jgi:hypothetical protein
MLSDGRIGRTPTSESRAMKLPKLPALDEAVRWATHPNTSLALV